MDANPIYFNPFGRECDVTGVYRNGGCFLICGGPSMRNADWDALDQPGILTASLNNAPLGKAYGTGDPKSIWRPDLWFSVDAPKTFHELIYRDPSVQKWCKLKYRKDKIRTYDGKHWVRGGVLHEQPNVWFYQHQKHARVDEFFNGPPTWWRQPARSVMFVAIRCLYDFGVRRIYLLGADFKMTEADSYSFDDPMPDSRTSYNNHKFKQIDDIFGKLLPVFKSHGLQVLNCTKKSRLTAFDFLPLKDAIRRETIQMPKELHSRGLYLK